MEINLRKAREEDREHVIWVESKSTPRLSYVGEVWDLFLNDEKGDFSVAEIDNQIIGCGKYTVLPDGSVWLETLRVIPERQGLGVGKRIYERWLSIAHEQKVKTMRMYTGVRNVVSKGLAERYGLTHTETFTGTLLSINSDKKHKETENFKKITDIEEGTQSLLSLSKGWGNWLVLNRTFYRITPELGEFLTQKGMIYKNNSSESLIVMGARFMPEEGLHIGAFSGNIDECLSFALNEGIRRRVKTLNCLFPSKFHETESVLTEFGFALEPSKFIVMQINI